MARDVDKFLIFLLTAHLGCAEIQLIDPPVSYIFRPGSAASQGYRIINGPASHTISFNSVPANVSCAAETNGDSGNINISSTAAANVAGASIRMIAKSGNATIAQLDLPALFVDPPPRRSSSVVPVILEDNPTTLSLFFQDDAPSLLFQPGLSTQLDAVIADSTEKACDVTITPSADFFGSATLVLIVTDALGDTPISIPINVTPANDPPVVAVAAMPTDVIADPIQGGAVRMAGDLTIGKGVDADVTRFASGRYLGWDATVDGIDGIDLLALAGIPNYSVNSTGIVRGGNTVASWTRPDGDTRRIRVTLGANGNQTHLQDIAGMLRYTCIQGAADEEIRTLSLVVREPDGTGDTDDAAPVTATCRVLAQNAPPVVTAAALGVVPEQGAPVALTVIDSDPPARILIRLVQPLPRAGSIVPTLCTLEELHSGVMRYTHTDTDESTDAINLTVDDGRNPPVAVQVPVQVRIVVDRMSVLSDPCLEVFRDTTLAWPLAFSCPASLVDVVPIAGSPLPLPPGAVTVHAASELRFDWSRIPPTTLWLPVQLEASTAETAIDAVLRHATQRMLIRIRPRPAVGSRSP